MKEKLYLLIGALSVLLASGGTANAHPTVVLRDSTGTAVNGTRNPYSPKVTCGLAACHQFYADQNSLPNIYEGNWDLAAKSHVNKIGEVWNYTVPYPMHGVTASYHVQMGRNESWGDVAREYYNGLESFTSSSGHYGRY